jgi:hypothetical protein
LNIAETVKYALLLCENFVFPQYLNVYYHHAAVLHGRQPFLIVKVHSLLFSHNQDIKIDESSTPEHILCLFVRCYFKIGELRVRFTLPLHNKHHKISKYMAASRQKLKGTKKTVWVSKTESPNSKFPKFNVKQNLISTIIYPHIKSACSYEESFLTGISGRK